MLDMMYFLNAFAADHEGHITPLCCVHPLSNVVLRKQYQNNKSSRDTFNKQKTLNMHRHWLSKALGHILWETSDLVNNDLVVISDRKDNDPE